MTGVSVYGVPGLSILISTIPPRESVITSPNVGSCGAGEASAVRFVLESSASIIDPSSFPIASTSIRTLV